MENHSQDTIRVKQNLPMNILVCGIKIKDKFIKSLFNDKVKQSFKNKGSYEEYDYSYGWKFQFFKEGLEEYNLNLLDEKIKADFKDNIFKDTILCFIDNSLEKAKDVIIHFSKMKIIYHTFIIFITINKKITLKILREYTESEDLGENEFDSRNIDIIYYDDNDYLPLFTSLFYKSCYFNEVGNEILIPNINSNNIEKHIKNKHCFNILIIGKPGTGKSTLINIMNGEKIAKESTGGGKVTNEICQYKVRNTNLVLYDTPGFGQSNELSKVEKYIKNEINNMKAIKEKFHCVIYMLNYQEERNIEESERKLINLLLDLNIPFFFVLNKSQKPRETKKNKRKIKDHKTEILREELNIRFKNKINLIKVINVNLKINQSDNCFGLDELFTDLYNYYNPFKINLNQLQLYSNDAKKTEELVKKSPFFEGLTCKEEILESLISISKKEITGFSAAAAAVGFIPIPMSDWPLLLTIQASMIIRIAALFGKNLKKSEASDIIKNLTKTTAVGFLVAGTGKIIGSIIKLFPGLGTAIGGAISASTAGAATFSLGLSAISFFTPDFGGDEVFKFFMDRGESFNKMTDKFKDYADLFKNSDDYLYLLSNE